MIQFILKNYPFFFYVPFNESLCCKVFHTFAESIFWQGRQQSLQSRLKIFLEHREWRYYSSHSLLVESVRSVRKYICTLWVDKNMHFQISILNTWHLIMKTKREIDKYMYFRNINFNNESIISNFPPPFDSSSYMLWNVSEIQTNTLYIPVITNNICPTPTPFWLSI